MSNTKEQIMESAERFIRSGGYGAFSFRSIADELGIKSSSVHYHFPTKDALCCAVTDHYRSSFLDNLGQPNSEGAVIRFVDAFSSALRKDGRICLCGVLAGEAAGLEESLRKEVQRFAVDCRAWLAVAIDSSPKTVKADPAALSHVLFAALEGAMSFAVVSGKKGDLKCVAQTLLDSWGIPFGR